MMNVRGAGGMSNRLLMSPNLLNPSLSYVQHPSKYHAFYWRSKPGAGSSGSLRILIIDKDLIGVDLVLALDGFNARKARDHPPQIS